MFKALGDDTRWTLFEELAASPRALSTAELAARLDLHPNTVRPHLERMREVGLLEVDVDSRGSVGRPQHRYRVSPASAAVAGPEPTGVAGLASLLAQLAAAAGASPDDAATAGRAQGRALAAESGADDAVAAVVAVTAALGFEPVAAEDGFTVSFAACPLRPAAEECPEVVCHLHRGITEGAAGVFAGGRVETFATLADPSPCRAVLAPAGALYDSSRT